MNPTLYVSDTRRDEIIVDAARRQTPVVVTRHDGSGWRTHKSRLVGCDEQARKLYLELPQSGKGGSTDLTEGELLGIAFRRGHKKCLFNAVVRPADTDLACIPAVGKAIPVDWPDQMQELQRRVYQRAGPPPGNPIRVCFEPRVGDRASGPAGEGVLDDLSAGGIRVRCAAAGRLEVGDHFRITFALRSRGPGFTLDAVYRHCESTPDQRYSLGFQFVGLETSSQGQEALASLARTVTDFQRGALRRRTPLRHRSTAR
ncbi:MAG: PilZ domain-containing protein [Planctomycetes bacterium]|nr:PilZ domain-containing protein [Planctomycetota bacterium]